MEDARENRLPEVGVVFGIGHGTPASDGFLVVPLRVSQQAENGRDHDGDPHPPEDALDESGDGIGSSDEVRPIPLLPKTCGFASHDWLLRKGGSWF